MDKNQVIEILSSKGFKAHDTNGILYVDLEDIGPLSIDKIRTMLKELHYYNSWGIKKIQAGVQPAGNVQIMNSSTRDVAFDNNEDEDSEYSNDKVYPVNSNMSDVDITDNKSGFDKIESTDDTDDDMDDDMTFDENSPFEQVSLFDII